MYATMLQSPYCMPFLRPSVTNWRKGGGSPAHSFDPNKKTAKAACAASMRLTQKIAHIPGKNWQNAFFWVI